LKAQVSEPLLSSGEVDVLAVNAESYATRTRELRERLAIAKAQIGQTQSTYRQLAREKKLHTAPALRDAYHQARNDVDLIEKELADHLASESKWVVETRLTNVLDDTVSVDQRLALMSVDPEVRAAEEHLGELARQGHVKSVYVETQKVANQVPVNDVAQPVSAEDVEMVNQVYGYLLNEAGLESPERIMSLLTRPLRNFVSRNLSGNKTLTGLEFDVETYAQVRPILLGMSARHRAVAAYIDGYLATTLRSVEEGLSGVLKKLGEIFVRYGVRLGQLSGRLGHRRRGWRWVKHSFIAGLLTVKAYFIKALGG
jgi:hypothetical protein